MPATLSYPGVYIEEIPSGVRTIIGVATSITAFVGRAARGPVNDPIRIQSFSDYVRVFGGLSELSTMSYAVQQFFLNGGTDALIVRVHRAGARAQLNLPTGGGPLIIEADNEGEWGNNLRATVDHDTKGNIPPATDNTEFNLLIEEMVPGSTTEVAQSETFLNVSSDAASPRFIKTILDQDSKLVSLPGNVPDRPNPGVINATANSGSDGNTILDAQINPVAPNKDGMFALEKADLFNLLCIPPLDRDTDISAGTRDAAAKYCSDRRALFVVDPPVAWNDIATAEAGVSTPLTFMTQEQKRRSFLPTCQDAGPAQGKSLDHFRTLWRDCGHYGANRYYQGSLEGPGRSGSDHHRCSRASRQDDGRRKWPAESSGPELPANVPCHRPRGLGSADFGWR